MKKVFNYAFLRYLFQQHLSLVAMKMKINRCRSRKSAIRLIMKLLMLS